MKHPYEALGNNYRVCRVKSQEPYAEINWSIVDWQNSVTNKTVQNIWSVHLKVIRRTIDDRTSIIEKERLQNAATYPLFNTNCRLTVYFYIQHRRYFLFTLRVVKGDDSVTCIFAWHKLRKTFFYRSLALTLIKLPHVTTLTENQSQAAITNNPGCVFSATARLFIG